MKTAAVLLLLPALGGRADSWFPLKTGHQWRYEMKENGRRWEIPMTAVEREGKGPTRFSLSQFACFGVVDVRVEDKAVLLLRTQNEVLEKPLTLLELPPKKGARWAGVYEHGEEVDVENLGEEEIQVPAGKFKAFKVRMNFGKGDYLLTMWYARDVGVVMGHAIGPASALREWTFELRKFEKA